MTKTEHTNNKPKIPMERLWNSQHKNSSHQSKTRPYKGEEPPGYHSILCVQSKIMAFELPYQGGSVKVILKWTLAGRLCFFFFPFFHHT